MTEAEHQLEHIDFSAVAVPPATGPRVLPTRFRGWHFRSRLEARYAVFFDALGIPFEYEPEGFDLGEAGWYLPDFYLPGRDLFCEVKGELNEAARQIAGLKARALSIATDKDVAIFVGGEFAPMDASADGITGTVVRVYNAPSIPWRHSKHGGGPPDPADWDDDGVFMEWAECDGCSFISLKGSLGGQKHHANRTCGSSYTLNSPRILEAFDAARGARFGI